MKIARVAMSDGRIALVEVVDGTVREFRDASGDDLVEVAMRRGDAHRYVRGTLSFHEVRFLAPVPSPPTVRDFMAFEQHVKVAVESTGKSVDPLWYEMPVFYFSNPGAMLGPGDEIAFPSQARGWDFELEVACVIGDAVRDTDPEDARVMDKIAGFTLLNDWSARDIGSREMRLGLGPAKAKDFGTSLGPWLATPDEFSTQHAGRFDEPLTATVNGTKYSEDTTASMHFSWLDLIARASQQAWLRPGDVLGSGTCGTGCLLELRITHGREKFPWLQPGDLVTMSSPTLGELTNTVGPRR
jgi:2-keto-4-pentenoate hydratase/2-oxohepta-3-ene-1,7-dioic acid hydratase in catechol pathway